MNKKATAAVVNTEVATQASGNSGQEAGTSVATPGTMSNGQDDRFRVAPPAPVPGAPLPNLPDLEKIRTRRHLPPQARPPVPSTRCSPRARGCPGNRPIVENSLEMPPGTSPVDSQQAFLPSSAAGLQLASNTGFPAIESLLGLETGAVSDSPFSVKWPASLLSPALQSISSSALFIKTDTTTQGNWKGRYGSDGYQIVNDAASYPAYAQVTTGIASYTWAASTTSVRALQKSAGGSTERIASCWYQSPEFSIDLNITDGKAHQIALYSLDWDAVNQRAQQVDILDAQTNAVLDSRSVRVFSDGIYLVWNLSGHVRIKVTQTGLVNSVVSGLFFGPARTNVALATQGGIASASSTTPDNAIPGNEFHPSAINDGNRSGSNHPHSGFWRDNTADIYPDWVQVEFDVNKTIDEIDVFTVQNAIESSPTEPTEAQTFSLYGITQFDVQLWNGASWVTVPGGQVTGNNKVWRKLTFSPVTTKKIRVLVHNALFNQSRVVELEAYEAVAAANVALEINGGAATASSTTPNNQTLYPGYNFSPAVAIDGDRKSGVNFWRDNTPDVYPDWLQVQFAGLRNISEVDVFTLQDYYQNPSEPTLTMPFSNFGITDFKAEYWNGSSWTMLPGAQVTSDSTGSTNRVWRKFSFAPVATDRIRVYVTGAKASYSRIVELEAYERAPTTTTNSTQNSLSDELAMARLDPVNRTGTGGEDLLSGNYNWTLPLLSLPARAGLDLGLSLSYNSLVWTKAGQTIFYDADNGFPSPGFRLGFPTIEPLFYNSQTGKPAYLLITPSGSRVELRQSETQPNLYEAADSSYLQLDASQMLLRTTNGTQLSYSFEGSAYQCTKVKDRNGNFISVTYDAGYIDNITDTLGRVITFNYYTTPQGVNTHNLISITQARSGEAAHALVTFGYLPQDLTIQTNFSGLSIAGDVQNGSTIPVLSQVCLDDATCNNFTYSTWGQVTRIDHYVQDNVNPNNWLLLNYVSYNLPANSSIQQSDCPRFTQKRLWAVGWNGDTDGVPATSEEALTTYSIALNGTEGTVTLPTVVYRNPDGSINSSISVMNRERFGTGVQKGLTTRVETYANGQSVRTSETFWTQDKKLDGSNYSYQVNPRPIETKVSDPSGNIRGTIIDYGAYASYGLPFDVSEYAGAQKTILRRTRNYYNLTDIYKERRIIGLVSARLVYDAAGTLSSLVEYFYDLNLNQEYLQYQGAAIQHDGANYPLSFVEGRGNLTRIVRWNVLDNQAPVLESRMGYNTQGSVIFTRDPMGHQNTISYADSFSDAGSHPQTFAYPTAIMDADGNSSHIKYVYDLGAVSETVDPKGATVVQLFDGAGRIDRIYNTFNNAFKQFHYGPRYEVTLVAVKNLTEPVYAITWRDGLGQPYAMAKDAPVPGAGGARYSAQVLVYDVMGRVQARSNQTEMEAGWIPTGDDVSGWQFTWQTYDWKGRPRVQINQDGTTAEAIYGGCGCAGGETVETRDEVGRRQKATSDVLGRLVKSQVFNPDGTDYSTVVNSYDALDHLTNARQYQGSDQSGVYQETTMGYDGYGRLASRRLPQQAAATVYSYYADDLIQTETDARGVTRSYSYNGRHLLTGISYPQAQQLPAGVAATPNVTFTYDVAGNRVSMSEAGLGSISYSYDQLSRLQSEERSFTGLSGGFALTYTYNLAGDLTSITDPFQSTVSYTRDHIGRTTTVTGAGFGAVSQFASDLRFRAWGALKHLTFGNQFSLDQTYTSRLKLLRSELHGAGQFGPSVAMGVENQYYNDGRIRFSRDLRSSPDHLNFDRAFEHDHVGRLSRALTGTEARGEGASNSNPYRQVYSWDVWDHLAGRDDRHWERSYSFTDTYVNNRRVGWDYDAEGNLTQDEWTRRYDGASREVEQTTAEQSRKQSYDGDGEVIKRVENGTTTYYVRSSIVDKVVTELNGSGQRTSTFVYLENQMLARYSGGAVWWEHYNPVSQSVVESNSSGAAVQLSERDPMGGEAGLASPYQGTMGPPEFSFEYYQSPNDVGLGNPTNPRSGCNLEGMSVPCDIVARMTVNGATRIASDMPQGLPLGFGGVLQQARITEEEPGGQYAQIMSPNLDFFQQPKHSDSWVEAVDETFDRVEGIFKNKPDSKCAQYFGPNALTVLAAMRNTATIKSKTDSPGATATGIQQIYSQSSGGKYGEYRLPADLVFIMNGPFFVGGKGKIGTYNAGTYGAQNAALLHELAHNIIRDGKYLIQNDGHDANLSGDNTTEIMKYCSEEIFDAK